MNAETCWGKNTIDPSGRGIEKPRTATLTVLTFKPDVWDKILPSQHAFVNENQLEPI
jgi:hypothetical protein